LPRTQPLTIALAQCKPLRLVARPKHPQGHPIALQARHGRPQWAHHMTSARCGGATVVTPSATRGRPSAPARAASVATSPVAVGITTVLPLFAPRATGTTSA